MKTRKIEFTESELNDLFHVLRTEVQRIDNTDWSKEYPARMQREKSNADKYEKLMEKVRP
ncbi:MULTISPECIES: hypothetical protein [unclassified Pedobacter]|uniref:hypothetical protein n=1 Tax=unclassified Pedobacter TaxID=2628915 RepID=UPI001420C3C6|nr:MULTISPECIES: hypothetical protein [unclassified Pedobacter]NII81715.1 hypothetical protein [Pedobacter sp. SG908]NMN35719.1 hypothetical protein [Pedobacter sp. SG918]